MYSYKSKNLPQLKFPQGYDFKEIQLFVNLKIKNPHYFQTLKQRQLIKIQLQKLKFALQYLSNQIESSKKKVDLQKASHDKIKSSGLKKNQEYQKIDHQLSKVQYQIKRLQYEKNRDQSQVIQQKRIRITSFQQKTQEILLAINNEKLSHKRYRIQTQQKTKFLKDKILLQKQQIQQIMYKIDGKDDRIKQQCKKIDEKTRINQYLNTTILKLKQNVQSLLNIKTIQQNKLLEYQKTKIQSQRKSQQQSIIKIGKFLTDLKQILDNNTDIKNSLQILLAIYCPPQTFRTKHDSIETSTSNRNSSQFTQQNVQKSDQHQFNPDQLPSQLLQSLKRRQKQNNLDLILNSYLSTSQSKNEIVSYEAKKDLIELQKLKNRFQQLQTTQSIKSSQIKQYEQQSTKITIKIQQAMQLKGLSNRS